MPVQVRAGAIHLSAAALSLFEHCPLAFQYRMLDRRPPDRGVDPATDAIAASAIREAIGNALRGRHLDPLAASKAIDEVLDTYGLAAEDRDAAEQLAAAAVYLVAARGGDVRWVEQLLLLERIPRVSIYAKLDLAIVGGRIAPLEVIRWTFAGSPVRSDAELGAAPATVVARLAVGVNEPSPLLRPIAITEVDLVATTARTVVLSDREVRAAYQRVKDAAAVICEARERGGFPARPGAHCLSCPWRVSCPAVAADSDAVPL